MKQRYIIFILSLLPVLGINAQIPRTDDYLTSPTMSSLGEYGSVPVSLYTGIPNISIPIYEAKTGVHSIPVSLSYHGGGVQPDRHPGWVGMGWTLHAGGSIMRIVHGKPDESDYYNSDLWNPQEMGVKLHERKLGWFFGTDNNSALSIYPGDIGNITEIESDELTVSELFDKSKAGIDDREVDEFIFSFLGFSGKFYYTEDQGWLVNSDKFMAVVFDVDDDNNYERVFPDMLGGSWCKFYDMYRSQSITNFKLIDASGNEYFFGGKENPEAIEYSVGFFSQDSEEIAATAWHLTKIKYADGREVRLNYQKKDFIAEMSINEKYDIYNCPHFAEGQVTKYNGRDPVHGPQLGTDYIFGSLISPSYLSSIDLGAAGKIEFDISRTDELRYPLRRACEEHFKPLGANDYSRLFYLQKYDADGSRNSVYVNDIACVDRLQWYKLTDIRVKNAAGRVLHHFNFTYNDDDPSRAGKERLALLSFGEPGLGKYTFDYDHIDLLPEYCSYNVDHWGFYAKTDIARIVTEQVGNTSITTTRRTVNITDPSLYSSKREPDPELALYGTLYKITYPTGGYTRFEFEPHTYAYKIGDRRLGIDTLAYARNAGGLRIRRIYNSDGTSRGEQLVKEYLYYDAISGDAKNTSGILLAPPKYKYSSKEAVTGSMMALSECFTSQSFNTLGVNADESHVGYPYVTEVFPDGAMSVNRFSCYADLGCKDIFDPQWTLGLQLFHPYTSYAHTRGLLQWRKDYDASGILKKQTEFSYEHYHPCDIKCMMQVFSCSQTNFVFDKYHYDVTTTSILPKSSTETVYDDNQSSLPLKTEYTYDKYYKQLKSVEQKAGDKELGIVYYTYCFDRYQSSPVFRAMVDNTIVDKIAREEHYIRNFKTHKVINKIIENQYSLSNFVSPEKITQKLGNCGLHDIASYRYGKYFNPILQQDADYTSTVYVWGYSHNYICAVIKGAGVDEVTAIIGDLDAFAETATPDFSKLLQLRSSLAGASVAIYRHEPGVGMTQCMNPDGTTLNYSYDSFGRLVKITDGYGKIVKSYDYNIAGDNLEIP